MIHLHSFPDTLISGILIENSPVIFDDHIFYVQQNPTTSVMSIVIYNISTATSATIPTGGNSYTIYKELAAYGDKIVWSDNRSDNWDVYLFNLTDWQEYTIANNINYNEENPDVFEDFVVFENTSVGGNKAEIYLHEITENSTLKIPNDASDNRNQRNASIYGTRVVFDANYDSKSKDIYVFDFSFGGEVYGERDQTGVKGGAIWKLTDTETDEITPDIFGDRVVYMIPFGNLVLYEFETNSSNIIYSYGNQPSIQGDKIVCVGLLDNVYLYDLSNRAAGMVRIDPNIAVQTSPAIYNEDIVWVDFRGSVNGDIYFIDQNYTLDVGDDGDLEWIHEEYFVRSEKTKNFADELNEYLRLHKNEADPDGYITIPLNITSEYEDYLEITNVQLEFEFLSDPMAIDTDGDNIRDGNEIFEFYGFNILEIEDAIDLKEWRHPMFDVNNDSFNLFEDYNFTIVPFIYQTGVTLTASHNYTPDNEGFRDSWIRLRLSIPETGTYRIALNQYVNKVTSVVEPAWIYRNGPDLKQRIPTILSKSIDVKESATLINNLTQMLGSAVYLEIAKEGGEKINPTETDVLSNFLIENTRKDLYQNKYFVEGHWQHVSEYNFTGQTDYLITIGINLDNVPTVYRTQPPNDPFGWQNVSLMRILDLDNLRVERLGIDPLSIDTDGDGLYDGFEAFNFSLYPLNPDADSDGLNDHTELYATKTDPGYRDSDYDGIRDGVEVGLTESEIIDKLGETSALGSWFERIARYGTPFKYEPIINFDADPSTVTDPRNSDTDSDGLPDGWMDGWTYEPSNTFDNERKTYQIENNRYKDIHLWRYDPDNWKYSSEIDYMVQVYEGEDLNLDGSSSGLSTWGFVAGTFEFSGLNNEETMPETPDTDSDKMPDGYEVWYSHLEPYKYPTPSGETYILDPTVDDGVLDKDPVDNLNYVNASDTGGPILYLDNTFKEGMEPPVAFAQRINISGANIMVESINKVALKLEMANNSFITAEIWLGAPDPLDPSLLKPDVSILATHNFVNESDKWFEFDFPDWIFDMNETYNDDETFNYGFFIVLRFTGVPHGWHGTTDPLSQEGYRNLTWYQDANLNWHEIHLDPDDLHSFVFDYKLYNYTFTGDNATNIQEYTVGINPKNTNSDGVYVGKTVIDDILNDGAEIGWDSVNETLMGNVIFRTNIADGAVCFDNYAKSGDWINYDGDGYRNNADGYNFTYNTTKYDPVINLELEMTSPDSILLFKLYDDSKIYMSTDHERLFVWSPGVDLNEPSESGSEKYIEGTSHEFIRISSSENLSDFEPNVTYRNQEIYISDPINIDTDSDGILDGIEISWSETIEITDRNPDTKVNVRDNDSDNDNLIDSWEIAWMIDFEGDGLENMIDPDSDNDGIIDGLERRYDIDTDGNGTQIVINEYRGFNYSGYEYNNGVNMLDPDSDGDGLADGFIEGKIWNWSQQKFVNYNNTVYKLGIGSSGHDPWEGEDLNRNGTYDKESEPDPLMNDTDYDGLWDGYDILNSTRSLQNYGELYDIDAPYSGGDHYRPHQSSSSLQNYSDSDYDQIYDGEEVFGYKIIIIDFVEYNNSSSPFEEERWVTSDPNDNNTDSDDLTDTVEQYFTDPGDTDTDNDGLSDSDEDKNHDGNYNPFGADGSLSTSDDETHPTDRDTDNDGLCDGWNDDGDMIMETGEYGEDFNGNGQRDISIEPNPLRKDSDDDKVHDGAEYFYLLNVISNHSHDSDSDSTPDILEFDSDNDGLSDGEENRNRNSRYESWESNATDADTDDDCLLDGAEPNPFGNSDGTEGLNVNDSDSNNDGLDDYDQTWVVFRKNRTEYSNPGAEIAVSPIDASLSTYQLKIFKYNSIVTTLPSGSALINISYKTKNRCVVTPEGYFVYSKTNGPEHDIYIMETSSKYYKFEYNRENGEMTNTHPLPKLTKYAGPPSKESAKYIINRWETYDFREVLDEDSDNDTLSNNEELEWDSNPRDADTDDDGVLDGYEREWNTDTDGDGKNNVNDSDSDNDGLSDGLERGLTFNEVNRTKSWFDILGIQSTNLSKFTEDVDPTTTTEVLDNDTDNDGLEDGEEDTNSNGEFNPSDYSDPLDADTDDDALSDGEENHNYNTEPRDPDSDNDGIYDGTEVGRSYTRGIDTNISKNYYVADTDPSSTTDPNDPDTDGDGIQDGSEDKNTDGRASGDINFNGQIDMNEFWIETDANDIDTDDDSLNDGIELDDSDGFTTNPLDSDTDDDGWWDGEEDKNKNGEWEAVLGDSHSSSNWDTIGETDPNNPDTDNDNVTDWDEFNGWYVEIFWQRNPIDFNGLPTSYHVTSDPLDSDTENDRVPDGKERAEMADPTVFDTDDDTFLDGNEYNYKSTLSGKESGTPTMWKNIDTSIQWRDVYWAGFKVCERPISVIDVEVWGYDLAGIKNIKVKVISSHFLNSREKEETRIGCHFNSKFTFDFNLESLVTEIWVGWDVRIEVTDINENMGIQEEHVHSGVQVLFDYIMAGIWALMEPILEWIWERIKDMVNYALKPIRNVIDSWRTGLFNAMQKAETYYDEYNELSDDISDELMSYLHGNLYYLISAVVIVITTAFLLIEIITLGAAAAVFTGVTLIGSLILALIAAEAVDLTLDWELSEDPTRSAGRKAWNWYKDEASDQYQDLSEYFYNMIISLVAIGIPIIYAAIADPTGLVASSTSLIFSTLSMLFTTITFIMAPLLWVLGLAFALIGFGLGLIAQKGVFGSTKFVGEISLVVSFFGISRNLNNLRT